MEAVGLSVKRGLTVVDGDDSKIAPGDCLWPTPAAQLENIPSDPFEPCDVESVKESFTSSWQTRLLNCNSELAIGSQYLPNEPTFSNSKSTDVLKSHISLGSDHVKSLISDGGLLKLPSALEFITEADTNGVPMCFRESFREMPLDFNKLPDLLVNASPEDSLENTKNDDARVIFSDAKIGKNAELLDMEKSLDSERLKLPEVLGNTELESDIDENCTQLCSYTTQKSDGLDGSKSKNFKSWNSKRPVDYDRHNCLAASSESTRWIAVVNGNFPSSECQKEVSFLEQVGFSESTGQPIKTKRNFQLSGCKEIVNSVEQSGSSVSPKHIIETKGNHSVSEFMDQVTISRGSNSGVSHSHNVLSECWSNLCGIQQEPLTASVRSPYHISDAPLKKTYKQYPERKFSAVRTFPSGCGPKNAHIQVDKGNDTVQDEASIIINSKWGRSKFKTKSLKQKELGNKLPSISENRNSVSRNSGRHIRDSKSTSDMPKNAEIQRATPSNVENPLPKKIKYINCLSDKMLLKDNDLVSRETVRETLRLFQALCRKLIQKEEINVVSSDRISSPTCDRYDKKGKVFGKHNRVDLTAFQLLKERGMFLAAGKQWLGHVPGIEVGDEFHYRVELCLTGLHRLPMAGIDFAKYKGSTVATCIVSSEGYSDFIKNSNTLIYEGEGGHPGYQARKKCLPGNQKLERGNLALKNSIYARTPVRVIHGYREQKANESRAMKMRSLATYVYDGLYLVKKYWSELGNRGFSVFKFELERIPDQPQIALKELLILKQMKVRLGLCMEDISKGKEKNAICAVNTIDNEVPMPFTYTTRMVFSSSYKLRRPKGCGCVGRCNPETCACLAKNGGEFPYNYDGAIVRAKSLVYECGPSCGCPSSCHNRVSQYGIKFPLEIFKTKSRGWGVRSLASIPSGSFICEYIGELLLDSEAEERDNDEYLFDIGKNYTDEALWEGLSSFIPNSQKDPNYDELDNTGFTIDAAKYGNVGRFINHSCTPNLYAQNVLYDHDDKRMPHIMLFAAENIPPLKELTYHYNYAIDQVHDMDGNIKKKACNCGSSGCTGWLY